MAIKAEQILRENIAKIRGNGTDRIYYTPKDPEPPKDPLEKATEIMSATILSQSIRNRFAWDENSQDWYKWTGNHWKQGAKREVFRWVMDEVAMRAPKRGSKAFISNVMELMTYKCELKRRKDRNILPFRNGLLNLDTIDIIPHNPNIGLTWCLPYDYDPQADCPVFLEWLGYVTSGDNDKKLLLQAYMNAIVRGYNKRQVCVELIGVAGSGKSTFQTICIELVGKGNTFSTDLFRLQNSRFETANLYEKRLVVINDSDKYNGGVSVFKAITGGDDVPFEQKNKQAGQGFKFQGLVLLAANESIRTSDYTSGLARRRLTVNFKRKINEDNLPTGYYDKMMEEIPGILNWCLSLSNAEVDEILTGDIAMRCKKAGTAVDNSLTRWMNENLVYDTNSRLGVGADDANSRSAGFAYSHYVDWCKVNNNQPIGLNSFSGNVIDIAQNIAGYQDVGKKRTKAGIYLANVRIRDLYEDAPMPVSSGWAAPSASRKWDGYHRKSMRPPCNMR